MVGICSPSVPQSANTKPCRVCSEEIKKSAIKCVHCDSYQDWRSKLTFSSTVLSLLVALVSVLTAAIPVFKDAITPKNSSLTLAFQGANANTLSLLVANQGIRPGSITTPVKLLLTNGKKDKGTVIVYLIPFGPSEGSAHIVEPGKSALIEYSSTTYPTTWNPFDYRAQCFIEVQFTDFFGNTHPAQTEASCEQLVPFTIANANRAAAKANAERQKENEKKNNQ